MGKLEILTKTTKKMKSALVITALVSSANAFSMSSPKSSAERTLSMSSAASEAPTINGWTADADKFCAGLPGALSPMGEFDPLGLTADLSVAEIKRYREAEVTHGRVSMLAVLGYLVGENFHPLFNGGISGPANTHLTQVTEVAPFFFAFLTAGIAVCELNRANVGWTKPVEAMNYNAQNEVKGAFGALLRDDYYPGDIGFDPLGLKPTDPAEFAAMQTKELQNGRLAMLAAMGMIVQEQITHQTIGETLSNYF